MAWRRAAPLAALAFLVAAAAAIAQSAIDFTCPMDRDVRMKGPGKCPRCGMTLQASIAELVEYPLELKVTPARIPAGEKVTLKFRVRDPKTRAPVIQFEPVHERLFHLFLVSYDLEYFAHVHPELRPDSQGAAFVFETTLPRPGAYRLLADYFPKGGTPQLTPKTITTAGYVRNLAGSITHPAPDLSPKRAENLEVELTTEPAEPIAGKKTLLFFRLKPAAGLEPYLGAWGHLLAASDDLIDTIHEHPTIADGGPQVQFDVFFPREAMYRVWVQFQRAGQVNTAQFTIPVKALR